VIRITRIPAYANSARDYKIYIDEECCGSIKENETIELSPDKGRRRIYAKIDWCRSNKLDIYVEDSVVELEVGAALSDKKVLLPLMDLIYVSFLKNRYLWIKEKEGNDI